MRTVILAAALAAAPHAAAQGNEVVRSNEPYHVDTPAVNPPQFTAPGPGVPAGTWAWRVIPDTASDRGAGIVLDGLSLLQRMSAATLPPWAGAVQPEIAVWRCAPRAGGGLDPDFGRPALVRVARAPLPPSGRLFRVNLALAPTNIGSATAAGGGLALATRFVGGENEAVPGTQGNISSLENGPTPRPTYGFRDPTGSVSYGTGRTELPWMSWTEQGPTLGVFSDWGRNRIAPLSPPLPGEGLGSYYADLASRPFGSLSELGHSLRASGAPNAWCVPLLNYRTGALPLGTATPFPIGGGVASLDLDPTDPSLLLLAGSVVFRLDGAGRFLQGVTSPPPPFRVPALAASAIGSHFGFEYLLFDSTLAVVGDTQACWVRIDR